MVIIFYLIFFQLDKLEEKLSEFWFLPKVIRHSRNIKEGLLRT